MKHFSFIATLSPQQQHEIRRWFLYSCALILLIITGITCYLGPDFYNIYTLKKEIALLREKTTTHTDLTNTKNRLKKENGELQKKRTHLNNYITHPKNPLTYLTTIINAGDDKTIIQSIRTNKKNIEITLMCPTTEHATKFAHHLAQTDYFRETHITSLQKHEQKNQFLCTLKGIFCHTH